MRATGDRYHLDAGGCFSYEGRVDDMPTRISHTSGRLRSHLPENRRQGSIDPPRRLLKVSRYSVVAGSGVDVDGLSRIKAFVIAAGDDRSDALADSLRGWCKQALQRYQYPHVVEFVDDLLRTATGKVQRFKRRG